MKIAVLGAGSIGCYLGGLLMAGKADVTLIGRERLAAQIAQHGLTLTHFDRPPLTFSPLDFRTGYDSLRAANIILLCTKSQDTAEAGALIAQYARPGVQVISFQNGIRNPQTLQDILPDASIVPGIVPFNVTSAGPGVFHCGTAGNLAVGPGIDPAVLAAFQAAGHPVHVDPDIVAAQWAKMIVNLNNALNALSGGTLRDGLAQRDYRRALALCVEEGVAVALANGIEPSSFNGRTPAQLLKTLRFPDWLYGLVMQLVVKIDGKARSSMLDDLEGGRISEVEYIQGEIVARAAKAKVPAPYNAKILQITRDAFAAGRSPNMTGAQIYAALPAA